MYENTVTVARTDFEAAEAELGCETEERVFNPFIPLFKVKGSFGFFNITSFREVSTEAQRGPNKGKKQLSHYYDAKVLSTNVKGVKAGDEVTISAPGLLHHILDRKMQNGLKCPFTVGILYTGKNDDGFHQVSLSWPKVPEKKS
jgi:hypothetical protein